MTKKEKRELNKEFAEICSRSSKELYEEDIKDLFKKWKKRGATSKEIQKILIKKTKKISSKSQKNICILERKCEVIELHSEIDWIIGELLLIIMLYACPNRIDKKTFSSLCYDTSDRYYNSLMNSYNKTVKTIIKEGELSDYEIENKSTEEPAFLFFNKCKTRIKKVKEYAKGMKHPKSSRDLNDYMTKLVDNINKETLSEEMREKMISSKEIERTESFMDVSYTKMLDITQYIRLNSAIHLLESALAKEEIKAYDKSYITRLKYIKTSAKTWLDALSKEMIRYHEENKYKLISKSKLLDNYRYKDLVVTAFTSIKELPSTEEVKKYIEYLDYLDKKKRIRNEYKFYKIDYIRK